MDDSYSSLPLSNKSKIPIKNDMKWLLLALLLGGGDLRADDDTATATASATSTASSTATATDTDADPMENMTVKDRVAVYNELLTQAPVPPPFDFPEATPLLWEDADHPERVAWSKYTFRAINPVLDDLSSGKDINQFCPNYSKITRKQQILVWAEIFANIAFWESSYDPLNNTMEIFADRGTDPVTHMPVYSSGLLQLSYQDSLNWGFEICNFNWEKDRKLPEKDIHRSLYNPFNNLYCGINIMARNVKKLGAIISHDHYYWSTLQSGNLLEDRHGQIERMVHKELPFCGGNKVVDFVMDHTVDPGLELLRNLLFPNTDK